MGQTLSRVVVQVVFSTKDRRPCWKPPLRRPSFAIDDKSSTRTRQSVRSFTWQTGYAVFSVSHSKIGAVKRYIEDQQIHHERVGFQSELLPLLKKHEIEYDETHLWT